MAVRTAFRAIVIAAAAGLLAACSMSPTTKTIASKEYFSPARYGAASPKVVAANQPVPKGGGRYTVGQPYRVAGKTYVPRDNPRYSKVGLASWYGAAFHGRLTANGEVYDVNGLTAAHPTLPLPSYARVTNLQNGRSVVVRINDRGPFAHDRLIDVSATVADMLGFKQAGTARVKVDYAGPARLDGLDHNMLLASYSESGRMPAFRGFTQLAAAEPQPRPGSLTLASAATPAPRVRPDGAAEPLVLTPAYASTGYAGGDSLGSLILRSGLTRSYAAETPASPAQRAAADLSAHDLTTALTAAAQRKAREMAAARRPGDATVVQLGSFSNPDNARRIAADFNRYGETRTETRDVGGRLLQVVLVSVDGPAATVIDAAASIGLTGAFVVSR